MQPSIQQTAKFKEQTDKQRKTENKMKAQKFKICYRFAHGFFRANISIFLGQVVIAIAFVF